MLFRSQLAARASTCDTRPPWFAFDPVAAVCGTWHTADDPCGCSEPIIFDPLPSATYYVVQRTSPGAAAIVVGRTLARTCAWWDDCALPPLCLLWEETPYWLPEWDCTHGAHAATCTPPAALPTGQTHSYRVQACNAAGCSPAWSPSAALYARGPWLACTDRKSVV